MSALTSPELIEGYRLLTLAQAVRLESVGMKRRGPSARSLAKSELGLKGSQPDQVLIDGLRAKAFALKGGQQ